ncbi:MAG: hypothetical protein CL438_09975, partial [Acidimicrobiaceae bacterium]|nr:hypothetical protein [Acidimicrobiaceae bacterium]
MTPGVASIVMYSEWPGIVAVVATVAGVTTAEAVAKGRVAGTSMPACTTIKLAVTVGTITTGQATVEGVTVAGTDGPAENVVVTPIVAGVAMTA